MALLGKKESKEEKSAKKAAEIKERYHLDDIDSKYADAVESIIYRLSESGGTDLAIALSGKLEESAKLSYLSTLVQQNWIIIRQLDELNKKLNK